jgi:hypothetical protein
MIDWDHPWITLMLEEGMNTNIRRIAATALSDHELLARLVDLAGDERHATVELVAHLAELDVRKLYLAQGYGSLFNYCTGVLRLSEHAAYKRIEAARIARMFPVVLERLADGSLNLTTLRLVGPYLRPNDHLAVLAEAAGRSKREVEVLIARLAPQPDVTPSVRKLPSSSAAGTPGEPLATVGLPIETLGAPAAVGSVVDWSDAGPVAALADVNSPARRPVVTASAPDRFRVQFTIGRETYETLRVVQDLLRREVPHGDLAAIFDRALRLLRTEVEKKKLGAASKPRRVRRGASSQPLSAEIKRSEGIQAEGESLESIPAEIELSESIRAESELSREVPVTVTRSRHIPAAVKRKVWLRDEGQCAFIAKTGRRCTERAFLEFHHVEPYAIGGETTAGNISLRCRSHNVHEAELAFGRDGITRSGASRNSLAPGRVG